MRIYCLGCPCLEWRTDQWWWNVLQNFPNICRSIFPIFVAAIFAREIGVKSVASQQALGICAFWQSKPKDYTCRSLWVNYHCFVSSYWFKFARNCWSESYSYLALSSWQTTLSVPLGWFVLSFCPIWGVGWLTITLILFLSDRGVQLNTLIFVSFAARFIVNTSTQWCNFHTSHY